MLPPFESLLRSHRDRLNSSPGKLPTASPTVSLATSSKRMACPSLPGTRTGVFAELPSFPEPLASPIVVPLAVSKSQCNTRPGTAA